MTKTTTRGTRLDHVVVPRGGTSIVLGRGGRVMLRALDEDGVQVEADVDVGCMLQRVDEPTELYDGDVLRAGTLWISFQAGRNGLPGRICLLDEHGGVRLGIALRAETLSLGREAGDVVIPWDDALAELHFQVLVRDGGVFIQDLATPSGTWVVVRKGEVLTSDSVIAIDGHILRVSTPPRRSAREGELTGPTKVFVAA